MARRADWVLPHGSFLAEAGREQGVGGGKTGAVLAASLSALMKALKKKPASLSHRVCPFVSDHLLKAHV